MPVFKVFLNPKASPAVTVTPASISLAKGIHDITWTRGKDQTFDFVDLGIPSRRRCFDTPVVKADKITVRDTHAGTPATTGNFHFDIAVSKGGRKYSTQPTLAMNRAPGPVPPSLSGDPTIRNT